MVSDAYLIPFDQLAIVELAEFVLPLVRVSAFLMALPLIGSKTMPARIRAAIAFLVTIVVYHGGVSVPDVNLVGVDGVILIAQQILIGAAMGFCVQLLFQIAVVAGQLIAMQNGLGFATFVDPVSGVNVATVGHFYLVATNLFFLVMNGHLVVIEALSRSLEVFPIGQWSMDGFEGLVYQGSWMFAASLVVALPAVTAVLISNCCFGVLSRVAPQMNIFVVGFPFNMIFGVSALYVSFALFEFQFDQLARTTFDFMNQLFSI